MHAVPVPPRSRDVWTGHPTAPRAEGGAGTSRADGWEGRVPARPIPHTVMEPWLRYRNDISSNLLFVSGEAGFRVFPWWRNLGGVSYH